MARPKWCCSSFETAYADRRQRSIFVFADEPSESGEEPRFWLASRALDFDQANADPPVEIPLHLALTPSTRKPVAFCPWCGTRLARFYRKRFTQLLDPEVSLELGGSGGTGGPGA